MFILDNLIIYVIFTYTEKEFSVLGRISTESKSRRVNFVFEKAIVRFQPFNVVLPPVGKGWFDTLYVNENFRLSRDVRGDYLISKKVKK